MARLYKWELRKISSAPAVWGFIALSAMLNLFFILSEWHNADYANEISREIAYTGATRYTDTEDIFVGYETAPIADAFVEAYKLQGAPEALMRSKYEKLQAIADRNAAIGAGLDIYADAMMSRDTIKSAQTTQNKMLERENVRHGAPCATRTRHRNDRLVQGIETEQKATPPVSTQAGDEAETASL